jgi:hypothetical protein
LIAQCLVDPVNPVDPPKLKLEPTKLSFTPSQERRDLCKQFGIFASLVQHQIQAWASPALVLVFRALG